MTNCPKCAGERWVCENHPDKPWNGNGCECGAGMPCAICNPCTAEIAPAWPAGMTEVVSITPDLEENPQ